MGNTIGKVYYSQTKSKWELSTDFIMIVGKYLESNKDFINIMKVCKKYKELVLMYKFNPINDISLFENIQTQHFYERSDVERKKDNLYQYIYWFNDDELIKNKKDNEIFKPINAYKYIINNISLYFNPLHSSNIGILLPIYLL